MPTWGEILHCEVSSFHWKNRYSSPTNLIFSTFLLFRFSDSSFKDSFVEICSFDTSLANKAASLWFPELIACSSLSIMSIGSFAVVPKTVENQVMDVTNQILLTHFFCKKIYQFLTKYDTYYICLACIRTFQ